MRHRDGAMSARDGDHVITPVSVGLFFLRHIAGRYGTQAKRRGTAGLLKGDRVDREALIHSSFSREHTNLPPFVLFNINTTRRSPEVTFTLPSPFATEKMIRFTQVLLCLLSMGAVTGFVQPAPKTSCTTPSSKTQVGSYARGGWNDYPTGSSFFHENTVNDSYTWNRSRNERKDDVYVNPHGPRYPVYDDFRNQRDEYRAYYPNTSYGYNRNRMWRDPYNARGLGPYTRGYVNNWYGGGYGYGAPYDVSSVGWRVSHRPCAAVVCRGDDDDDDPMTSLHKQSKTLTFLSFAVSRGNSSVRLRQQLRRVRWWIRRRIRHVRWWWIRIRRSIL